MKLLPDWKHILKNAWSVKFMAFAAVVSGCETIMQISGTTLLTRAGRLYEMEVKVEARRGAGDAANEAAKVLARQIKDTIGITAWITVVPPDGIERSQGKAKRIVDLRPRDAGSGS